MSSNTFDNHITVQLRIYIYIYIYNVFKIPLLIFLVRGGNIQYFLINTGKITTKYYDLLKLFNVNTTLFKSLTFNMSTSPLWKLNDSLILVYIDNIYSLHLKGQTIFFMSECFLMNEKNTIMDLFYEQYRWKPIILLYNIYIALYTSYR